MAGKDIIHKAASDMKSNNATINTYIKDLDADVEQLQNSINTYSSKLESDEETIEKVKEALNWLNEYVDNNDEKVQNLDTDCAFAISEVQELDNSLSREIDKWNKSFKRFRIFLYIFDTIAVVSLILSIIGIVI